MKTTKLTIKTFLLLTMTICMSSCDSFLDRQETEELTFDKVWDTRANSYSYWLTTMSYLPTDAMDFQYTPWMAVSDEGTCHHRDRSWQSMISGAWNPSDMPYSYIYTNMYQGIRECNNFLQNIDYCQDPLLTTDEREQWKAQTRFARAYYYFLMLRVYGPVPILEDEILDFTLSAEELERPRNSWEECVQYVIDEMAAVEASPYIRTNWTGDTDMGLATKGTAQAVTARLLLYSARPLFNGNSMYKDMKNPDGTAIFSTTYDASKWKLAAEASKKIIDAGQYSLHRDETDDPYANYYGITQDRWNSEIIWSRNESRWIISAHTVPTGVTGTAWGGQGPTQQQVDCYAMASTGRYPITGYNSDGSPKIDEASGYPTDEMTQEEMTYPAWGGESAYQIETAKMMADREPRFYVTVFFSSQRWVHGVNTYTVCSFANGANSNVSDASPKSGYMLYRLYDHTANSVNGVWGNITFPTFRLGEVYLNFIEAALECAKNGVTTEYLDQAMALWDEIRDRSGMAPITDIYSGIESDYDRLIELYRLERRIELAYENHRFFDTRTWLIAEETDGGQMWGMNNSVVGSGEETPAEFWERVSFETRVFEKKHYLFPFEQGEIELNKQLVQNYEW